MNKLMKFAVVGLGALALISGCGREKKAESEKKAARPVVVGYVRRSDVKRTLAVTGTVQPVEDSVISPEVVGRIAEVRVRLDDGEDTLSMLPSFSPMDPLRAFLLADHLANRKFRKIRVGDYVKKGDILAFIDRQSYDTARRAAEAELKAARASLERFRATQKQLKEDLETAERLLAKKIGTQKDLDKIRTGLAEANALVEMNEAQVQRAKVALELAKLDLERTTVRCPLEKAWVAEVNFDVGEYVGPSVPIIRLVNIEEVFIEVGVGEKRIIEIENRVTIEREKSPDNRAWAEFIIPTLSKERTYKGAIEQISPYADPDSGTFKVRLRYRNVTGRLKGGMFAKVFLPINTRENSLVVPRSALVTEGSRHYVFVVTDGLAHRKRVTVGVIQNEEVEITRGLKGDEEIITDGVDFLEDGDSVVIQGTESLEETGPETEDDPAGD